MDAKSLQTLEYPKVLDRLAHYAAFSVSAELAHALRPTTDLEQARLRLKHTSEARLLLSLDDGLSVGGVRDVRGPVDLANHGGVLTPVELLEVLSTLEAARNLGRKFTRTAENAPALAELASGLVVPGGIIDAVNHAISERGDVLDSASQKLGSIRSQMKVARERLFTRLGRYLNDPATAVVLQESLITQRNGRYVIPLRAEFKGRIKSIVHDQSASGATLFVEPLTVVELNNELHELELAERSEIQRILAELSNLVGANAPAILQLVEVIAQIDLVLMCARYADDLNASEPELMPFTRRSADHPGSVIRLRKARHPLLDPAIVVPLDMVLDPQTFALVITGPNTGGKTVSLKTVGLMVLMAQSGMHIPAESGSQLSLFQNIFADIGDEQSIEQSLSTFSGHITNITRVLKQAAQQTLVLFDELGAGTDPQEGAALARAILAYLVEKRIPSLVATHFPELKTYAHMTPGVVNASMEFDIQTLRPTYRLSIGLPGRSNGLLISERLGLFPEIIQAARTALNPDDLRTDGLLDQIYLQRDLEARARQKAELAAREADARQRELTARLEKIEDERLAILEGARQEAEATLEDLQQELKDAKRVLERTRQPLDEVKQAQELVEELQAEVKKPTKRQPAARGKRGALQVGEKVHVRTIKAEGIITSISGETAEVQAGALRLKARLDDLKRLSEVDEPAPPPLKKGAVRREVQNTPANRSVMRASPGLDVDLRGERVEEALDKLERHIESAYLAGLPMLRVIHGKGTGRLREVIRQQARQMAHVSAWEPALDAEGGEGVTILRLHSSN